MGAIKNIPAKTLNPGILGHYVHGEQMTLGLVELAAGSEVPLHQHRQEQITYIIEGQLDMVIGGEALTLKAGDAGVIPANTPHSAQAIRACTLIDVFSPVREDYRNTDTANWNHLHQPA